MVSQTSPMGVELSRSGFFFQIVNNTEMVSNVQGHTDTRL